MKRHFSLNWLLHNDKLMMVVSLILALFIWYSVVNDTVNVQQREITGVPISITLNDYARETMKLRIVEGAEATATVLVEGPRSVVGSLTADDITITADTGNVIDAGPYILDLRPVADGDFTIISVVGKDGTTPTTKITCDAWIEKDFDVVVEHNLTSSDPTMYLIGDDASISGSGVSHNKVTLSGPRSDINRVQRLVAQIPDEMTISETTVFKAELIAFDANNQPIKTLTVVNAEDSKVSVTVPVRVYHKMELTPVVKNIPAGYEQTENLVTVTPSEIELWSLPSELDEYVNKIKQQLVVDFDRLDKDGLDREFVLESTQGVHLLNKNETVRMKVNLSRITVRNVEVPLSDDQVLVQNCPEGITVKVKQERLPNIRICGPSSVLNSLDVSDIVLVLDMSGKTAPGPQVVRARLQLPKEKAWVCYEDSAGVEVKVEIMTI